MLVNFEKYLGVILITLALIFSTLSVSSIFYLSTLSYSLPIGLLFFAISLISPNVAIYLLLFVLPLFGNKPASSQAIFLIFLNSLWLLAFTFKHYKKIFSFSSWSVHGSNTIVALSVLYTLISWLSLTSLPASILWKEMNASLPGLSGNLLMTNWWNFLKSTENLPWFPILSTLLTTQICCTFLYLILSVKNPERFIHYSFISVSAGLLFSLLCGIFDYYNFLDLTTLRNLDSFTNPDNVQFRLQSFFGHSGWYAEYVVLASSTLVCLLSFPGNEKLKKTFLIFALLIVQLTLILTFQRGSWVTFPIILFSMMFLLNCNNQLVPQARLRGITYCIAWLILLITLPIITVYGALRSDIVKPDHRVDFSSYVARFQKIDNSSDRSQFMKSALWITAKNPILGHGSDSYAYQYHNYFNRKHSRFFKLFDLPLHGTAHSLYSQILSGKGIIGFLCFISILILTIYKLSISLKLAYQQRNCSNIRTNIALLAFFLSFTVYGFVQELFYIHNLEFLFFIMLTILVFKLNKNFSIDKKNKLLIIIFLTIATFTHLIFVNFFMPSPVIHNVNSYGCYLAEKQSQKTFSRWCKPTSQQIFKVIEKNNRCFVKLKYKTHFFQPNKKTAHLQIRQHGKVLYQQMLSPGNTYKTAISIDPLDNHTTCPRQTLLEIKLDTYFIPQTVFGKGDDFRILGLQLLN